MILLEHLPLAVLAFLLEIVDGSIGMGYGTILSPALLLMGFDPLKVVPAVLVSQLAGDSLAAFFHHKLRNVDFSRNSRHFKVAISLSLLSLVASATAVIIAVNLSRLLLNIYIGTVFSITGLIVLANVNRNFGFSWFRLLCLGCLAAFNKGISGGGYGPTVTAGQILSGVEAKSAIGIISLAEGITCAVALTMFFLVGIDIDWSLSAVLAIGVMFSTPLTALIVRKVRVRKLKLVIGVFTLLLGLWMIIGTVAESSQDIVSLVG